MSAKSSSFIVRKCIKIFVSDPVLQARGFLLLSVPFFPKIKIIQCVSLMSVYVWHVLYYNFCVLHQGDELLPFPDYGAKLW